MNFPSFYDPDNKEALYAINHERILAQAASDRHLVQPSAKDARRVLLIGIDCQIDFVYPGWGLPVTGAVEDMRRLTEFLYKNVDVITDVAMTMDTHKAFQIFHPQFFIDKNGNHPPVGVTVISEQDIRDGVWRVNPAAAYAVYGNPQGYNDLQQHAAHYTKKLAESAKQYPLMIWPHHTMLGSIGHALVPILMEAVEYHNALRGSQVRHEIKGGNAKTENYGILAPEVTKDRNGNPIGQINHNFFGYGIDYDMIIIGGEAKSHCLASSIDQFLEMLIKKDPTKALAKKIFLLEDCTSPVIIPGVIDFTDEANAAFDTFKKAGMNVVNTTDLSWLR